MKPDTKRLAYGLREATAAISAPVVSMQLLPSVQAVFTPVHCGENVTIFFLPQNVAAAKGLDRRPTLCSCVWHHRSSTGGARYDDAQTIERRGQA